MFMVQSMIYAGAHTDILVYHRADNQVERIPTEGPWLGIDEDVSHATDNRQLRLAPGDVVLFHTDGVTEARDADGRLDVQKAAREVRA